VIYRKNGLDTSRYLFCTDRKIKRAVKRNRIKRILRDIVLRKNSETRPGFDIALIAMFELNNMTAKSRDGIYSRVLNKIK